MRGQLIDGSLQLVIAVWIGHLPTGLPTLLLILFYWFSTIFYPFIDVLTKQRIEFMFADKLLCKLMVIIMLMQKDAISAVAINLYFDHSLIILKLPISGPRTLVRF